MKCGETCHETGAVFCHVCGNKLIKSNKKAGIIIAFLIIFAIVVGIVIFYSNNTQFNSNVSSPIHTKNNYEQYVKNTVQALCEATINNDYGRIAELYAFTVKRYHSIYDVTNAEVVERYRNYNNKFGVYSKRASIRWNTLQVWEHSNGYSVVYVEDYHIDREDKSKYSDFVLEKHIELDTNFKIVSEYDVQLSKSK